MEINFIITCFNREDYWPYLKKIIQSYKKIKPNITYCYSGDNKDILCDYRCKNRGHVEGDTDLMIGGYNLLKNNGINKWIKICVDSWLLDEQKIIDIFNIMEKNEFVYAGNKWGGDNYFSTDIFFAIDDNFKFMKKFTEGAINYIENIDYSIEGWMRTLAVNSNKYYIIPEREPIIGTYGNRFFVENLSWTMKHDLKDNIEQTNQYLKKLNIGFKKIDN
jgi:hypothetical protein